MDPAHTVPPNDDTTRRAEADARSRALQRPHPGCADHGVRPRTSRRARGQVAERERDRVGTRLGPHRHHAGRGPHHDDDAGRGSFTPGRQLPQRDPPPVLGSAPRAVDLLAGQRGLPLCGATGARRGGSATGLLAPKLAPHRAGCGGGRGHDVAGLDHEVGDQPGPCQVLHPGILRRTGERRLPFGARGQRHPHLRSGVVPHHPVRSRSAPHHPPPGLLHRRYSAVAVGCLDLSPLPLVLRSGDGHGRWWVGTTPDGPVGSDDSARAHRGVVAVVRP